MENLPSNAQKVKEAQEYAAARKVDPKKKPDIEGAKSYCKLIIRNIPRRIKTPCPPAKRTPLPQKGVWFKQRNKIFPLLVTYMGTYKRAAMVEKAIELQMISGECFCSARVLALAGEGCEKTWDRALQQVKGRGVVGVTRLSRRDGFDSVNLIDWRALWKMITSLLALHVGTYMKFGRTYHVKIGGWWLDRDEMEKNSSPSNSP